MNSKEIGLYFQDAVKECKKCRYYHFDQNEHFCGKNYLIISDILYHNACKKLFKELKITILGNFANLLEA